MGRVSSISECPTAFANVVMGLMNYSAPLWLPEVMVRNKNPDPLLNVYQVWTFVYTERVFHRSMANPNTSPEETPCFRR